jgi:hypothetical protein
MDKYTNQWVFGGITRRLTTIACVPSMVAAVQGGDNGGSVYTVSGNDNACKLAKNVA